MKKILVHENCPGKSKAHLVNPRDLVCASCKVRPKSDDIRLEVLPDPQPVLQPYNPPPHRDSPYPEMMRDSPYDRRNTRSYGPRT